MLKKRLHSAARRLTSSAMVTSMVSVVALSSLLAQLFHARAGDEAVGQTIMADGGKLSVWKLNRRVDLLHSSPDPAKREMLCLPLSAMARMLDRKLDPTARIFVDGALGNEQPKNRSLYMFLQNYLFPREVDISLDGKAVVSGVEFKGVPFRTQDELAARGFDAVVRLGTEGSVDVIPLTPKGGAQ